MCIALMCTAFSEGSQSTKVVSIFTDYFQAHLPQYDLVRQCELYNLPLCVNQFSLTYPEVYCCYGRPRPIPWIHPTTPYSRIIKYMYLYFHRKPTFAYKRVAPNNEV